MLNVNVCFYVNMFLCTIYFFQSDSSKENEHQLLTENSIWKNDPANLKRIKQLTPELRNLFLEWGPCQPKEHELPNNEYPKNSSKRSFHSSWYSRKLLDSTFEQRNWLTYSPKLNKVFCLYCIIYGNNSNDAWVKYGFSHWKNGHMALVKHETTSAHIMASLKVKLKASCLPLLPSLVEEHNQQVSFNRELVKQLIEITTYLGQHNHSFRGQNEN